MPSFNIVFEGCCHGNLDSIYSQIEATKKPVDLVLIGGDFQAIRAHSDLQCMSVPVKYRQLGDFKKYYDGEAKAPYLTIFIGGNHEASNYLQELYYGGWVAPNIYYLGASGVLTYKNVLRIAGLSGIYNGRDYGYPRTETVPYSPHDVRSTYHIRRHEVDKLKMLENRRIDVMLSHDWPAGIEHHGNLNELLRKKKFFKQDIERGELGSPPAMELLQTVRPSQWLSAHLHVRFTANVKHSSADAKNLLLADDLELGNQDEIFIDELMDDDNGNQDEILLDDIMDEDGTSPDDKSQPPLLIAKPESPSLKSQEGELPYTETKFLALDKCMPRRAFLEFLTIDVPEPSSINNNETITSQAGVKRGRRSSSTSSAGTSTTLEYHPDLSYDSEWLAITRSLNPYYPHQQHDKSSSVISTNSADSDSNLPLAVVLQNNRAWVKENIVDKSLLSVPLNFKHQELDNGLKARPTFSRNNQTDQFCSLLEIENQVLVQQKPLSVPAYVPKPKTTSRQPNSLPNSLPKPKPHISRSPKAPLASDDLPRTYMATTATAPLSLPKKPSFRTANTVDAPTVPAAGPVAIPSIATTDYPTYAQSSDDEDAKPAGQANTATSKPLSTEILASSYSAPTYEVDSSDSE